MSSSQSRIGALGLTFLAAAAIVLTHLFFVMVSDHDVWAARSHQNRWAFRSVPSLRGAIHDRKGRVLVHDEPTMQVTLFYQHFRLYHPVGAAVHGATVWANNLQPGRELVNYSYAGVLGPHAAVRDLLAMPVSVFRPGKIDKKVAGRLATAVTTVLSGTTGMPRRRVYGALRDAAELPNAKRCGDALPGFAEAELLAAFDQLHESLRTFDELLRTTPEMQLSTRRRGLIERLDWQRRASIERQTVIWADENGEEHKGELYESMEWPVAEYVPFAMAAPLRVGARAHPGLRVRPGVRRTMTVPQDSSLRALLGVVRDVGRAEYDGWMEDFVASELPDGWLEDIVPAEAAVSEQDRKRMQQTASSSFKRQMRRFERRGTAGVESAFDDELSGRLGLRLVERDSRQREQLMWSSLQVKSGDDVNLTIDFELQSLVDQIVDVAQREMMARHLASGLEFGPNEQKYVQATMAVVDARTGEGVTRPPNGALGSVVKPFVLIEQLLSESLGRRHLPLAAIEPCSGDFRYGGTTLHCDHAHWEETRFPVPALAKSCNLFYYQVALGLERPGVMRALRRFGLDEPARDSEFWPCWQGGLRGMVWLAPSVAQSEPLPKSAIGYGVQASPLAVARAYAGLATGRLPQLGLLAGQSRPVVTLAGLDAELDVVRQGLRECVLSGTAKDVPTLARFGVLGKTGTAQVSDVDNENNAWFAGYVPWTSVDGVQLCFCSVVYWVPDGTHGAESAGGMVASMLEAIALDPQLRGSYLR